MDLNDVKKFLSLFMLAFGILIVIFLIYTTFLISHYAKQKQRSLKNYAKERPVNTPTITPTRKIK